MRRASKSSGSYDFDRIDDDVEGGRVGGAGMDLRRTSSGSAVMGASPPRSSFLEAKLKKLKETLDQKMQGDEQVKVDDVGIHLEKEPKAQTQAKANEKGAS